MDCSFFSRCGRVRMKLRVRGRDSTGEQGEGREKLIGIKTLNIYNWDWGSRAAHSNLLENIDEILCRERI